MTTSTTLISEGLAERYLFFDTETSDMIKFKLPNSASSQPWVVQLAAMMSNGANIPLQKFSLVLHSEDLPMSPGAQAVHGISKEHTNLVGVSRATAFSLFIQLLAQSTHLVAHNASFDLRILKILAQRVGGDAPSDFDQLLAQRPQICTMRASTRLCALPFPSGKGGYKWPKLEELYKFLFDEELTGAHDALVDIEATARCFFELRFRGVL